MGPLPNQPMTEALWVVFWIIIAIGIVEVVLSITGE